MANSMNRCKRCKKLSESLSWKTKAINYAIKHLHNNLTPQKWVHLETLLKKSEQALKDEEVE